jgi:hypothetical protein
VLPTEEAFFAVKIGIWEKDIIRESEVYERGITVADVMIGWIYGIAAVTCPANIS